MKQEMVRDAPLDMQPYAMILGTHRQPNKGIDRLLHTDDSAHIIIISNNNVIEYFITIHFVKYILLTLLKFLVLQASVV